MEPIETRLSVNPAELAVVPAGAALLHELETDALHGLRGDRIARLHW
jgi:hypothetical protein